MIDDVELGCYSFMVGFLVNGIVIIYVLYLMSVVSEFSGIGSGCGCIGSGVELGSIVLVVIVSW